MAKVNFNVAGKSIKELTTMDWEDVAKLSRKELAKVTSRLVSASNKRIRRLEERDLGSAPALKSLRKDVHMTDKGYLTVKGKKHGEIEHIYKKAREFLNRKTSTVKGYKGVIKKSRKQIEDATGQSFSDTDINKLFEVLHKGQQAGIIDGRGTAGSFYARDILIPQVLNDNPNATAEEILSIIDKDDLYKKAYDAGDIIEHAIKRGYIDKDSYDTDDNEYSDIWSKRKIW